MGGCATKPKELKDAAAAGEAPVPVPEKEEVIEDKAAVKEEVTKKEGGVGGDDEANKRRSLSNLFKESEEKSLEHVEDEPCEAKQASELSESNKKEVEKPKSAEEQMPAPVVDAPAKIEAEKTPEVASTIEAPKLETSVEEKTEGEKDEIPEVKTEEEPLDAAQKCETPVAKKTEEKPTTDAQQSEKKAEEAPATPQIEEKKPPSAQEKTIEN